MSEPILEGQPSKRLLKQIGRLNKIAGSTENAYKLGPKFTKLELFLINNTNQPASTGLKQFWRNHLPAIKFHNEDLTVVLTRINATKEEVSKVPAKIKCFGDAGSVQEIDCLDKPESEILKQLFKVTEAQPVDASEIPYIETPKYEL